MNNATASPYAYIVAANTRYLPGLNAIINSLDLVGNKHDLHVLSWTLPRAYLDAALSAGLSYRVIFHDITADEIAWLGESEVLMRKRYAMPSLLNYDAYCILDADMFFCHNVDRYLEIAHKTGLVLGCTLERERISALGRYGEIVPSENFKIAQILRIIKTGPRP